MSSTTFAKLALLTGIAIASLGASCENSEGALPSKKVDHAAPTPDSTLPAAAEDTTLERRADHARIQGNPNAELWVIEISDFQCPYCKEWHDATYPVIKREFVDPGTVRFAYINYPLSSHRNAWPAAEAAMCAAAQDKFWEMHDALFASQSSWENLSNPTPVFDSLATKAGVDIASYRACTTQHALRSLIQADAERATESGVNSTPSFLIGNTLLRGAQPAQAFRQAITEALAKSKRQ